MSKLLAASAEKGPNSGEREGLLRDIKSVRLIGLN
jgi:hypothetical protein